MVDHITPNENLHWKKGWTMLPQTWRGTMIWPFSQICHPFQSNDQSTNNLKEKIVYFSRKLTSAFERNGKVVQETSWAATWQNQQNDCAPSEDSAQPGHPPSLIRVFDVRMKEAWVLSYPLSAQRRLWSDWADDQAGLSLRWAHTHFVGFVMSRLSWLYFLRYTSCIFNKTSVVFSWTDTGFLLWTLRFSMDAKSHDLNGEDVTVQKEALT